MNTQTMNRAAMGDPLLSFSEKLEALKALGSKKNVIPLRGLSLACEECRKPFQAKRRDARYCSVACQKKNRRRNLGTVRVNVG